MLCVFACMSCDGGVVTSDPRADVLRINEVMASNQNACLDDVGEADDWIELFNSSDSDVELTGATITDNRDKPNKKALDGLTVPAGGVLLLYADDEAGQGPLHLPFKLSAAGEEVVLFIGDAIVDEVVWTSALTDVSLARFPDGSGDFSLCALSTCGAVNGAACE